MDDYIRRNEAIDVLATMQGSCTSKAALVQNSKIWKQIKNLPSADVIPVSWIEEQIKRLKEMDNEFASLAAGNISSLLKTWRNEVKDG